MSISRRRVTAVFRKEIREYRRNGNVVYAMVILPVVFVIQPTIQIIALSGQASPGLRHEHALVYMLGIPALVPAALAAYSVVGEKLQGTLEPLLTTPVRSDELLLGKALAAFLPAVTIAYAVYGLFIAAVELLAAPSVASALIQPLGVLAQVIFTPLLCGWSIWIGIAVSARSTDPRTAGQLSVLVSLPAVVVTSLIAFNVIPISMKVTLGFGVGLLVVDRLGWRAASGVFDRERLITSVK